MGGGGGVGWGGQMVVAVRSGGNIVLAETSISYPSPLALQPVFGCLETLEVLKFFSA